MLRTSFIVGFPGETEADFRELCDFVRAAEFDWMGVFAYSDVENAASHALGAKVDPEKIADRRDRLMKLQRKISARRLRRFVGRTLPALVEGPGKEQELVWEARLQGMAPEIDGKLYLSDLEPPSGGAPARCRRYRHGRNHRIARIRSRRPRHGNPREPASLRHAAGIARRAPNSHRLASARFSIAKRIALSALLFPPQPHPPRPIFAQGLLLSI